ncbi:hypothetical protein GCM10009630_14090 [Kribbella jejuensis]|uniref:Cell division protein FtsB n=1 Tax=Kribbella jejuensis TaxID=236068 RepID=A0A542DAA4_9ACTN|nr:hypothetical protein [Kribbella jejuensis]TQJ00002.1 hypothetical protein FB475_6993 [Kribbella jejuensis]
MSTVFSPQKARVTPAPGTTGAKKEQPRLRVVYGAPFRPPRMPFVIFVVSLLAAGLVGLLLLNTQLQSGTFDITKLNSQANDLRDQQQQLEKQVRALESPQNLSDRALRMGMVPNPNPVFLRLSDGRVLGVPAEGKAGAGTAMFGPQTPTTKPATKPVVKPTTPVKPATGTTAATTKPPTSTTKPPTSTTKPPTGATKPATTKKPATTTRG